MSWPSSPPTSPLPSNNYDAPGDPPAGAREELLLLRARVDLLSSALSTVIGNGDPTLLPGRLLRVRRWNTAMAATEIGLLAATKSFLMEVVASGGSGGSLPSSVGSTNNQAGGSGGGAGGYVKAWVPEVPANVTSVTLAVGAAAVSVLDTKVNGNPTTLQLYTVAGLQIELKALGGDGGQIQFVGDAATISLASIGGEGGNVSITGGSVLQLSGGKGKAGYAAMNLGPRAALAGRGADGPFGVGGYGAVGNASVGSQWGDGGSASGYGAGGGGAAQRLACPPCLGGTSSGGFAVMWEFC